MFILGRGQVRAESSTEAFKLLTGVVLLQNQSKILCRWCDKSIKFKSLAGIFAASWLCKSNSPNPSVLACICLLILPIISLAVSFGIHSGIQFDVASMGV